jgi:uncharacterized phage-associated protein
MYSVFEIANYILVKSDEEMDLLSNLKLQKLVYYAQGISLGLYQKPLFSEKIEKWIHGPVVPDLYRTYKRFRSRAIQAPKEFDISIIDDDTRELLDEVYKVYGRFSASALRNMSHLEPPWVDAEDSEEISLESMEKYFKSRVNNGED